MTQTFDLESGNFIGVGEDATHQILKKLTNLPERTRREFPRNGIYRQVPIWKLIPQDQFDLLSEPHQKGSIDIFLLFNQKKVAVRVQGPGHGEFLKGLGKAKHDDVQENLLKNYCEVVNIEKNECKNVFKERINEEAKNEIISSFKTAKVLIPTI